MMIMYMFGVPEGTRKFEMLTMLPGDTSCKLVLVNVLNSVIYSGSGWECGGYRALTTGNGQPGMPTCNWLFVCEVRKFNCYLFSCW